MKEFVLLDLDGTLVDSADGILSAMAACIERAGLQPKVALTPSLIGPPLSETLGALVDGLGGAQLQSLIVDFKRQYDDIYFQRSRAYPEVAQGLRRLVEASHRLVLVTNKRLIPTRKILSMFGWEGYFDAVYPGDPQVPVSSKVESVARALRDLGCGPQSAWLVGDTEMDAIAASANRVDFLGAGWGYGGAGLLAGYGPVARDFGGAVQRILEERV